jgi:hypothetical protein
MSVGLIALFLVKPTVDQLMVNPSYVRLFPKQFNFTPVLCYTKRYQANVYSILTGKSAYSVAMGIKLIPITETLIV